jgi:hypothetical protein
MAGLSRGLQDLQIGEEILKADTIISMLSWGGPHEVLRVAR